MPRRRAQPPPFINTFCKDLREVSAVVFVYFLGSLILWPFILVISILLIPVTILCRQLLMSCCLPCTCNRCGLMCQCRVRATAIESSWIRAEDKLMTHREFEEKLRNVRISQAESNDCEAQLAAQAEPLMSNADNENPDNGETHQTNHIQTPTDGEALPAPPTPRKLYGNAHSLVIVVEKSLNLVKLVKTIDTRIIQLNPPDSTGKYFPRFSQCLVRIAGGSLVWVNDPCFKLSKQVVVHGEGLPEQRDLEKLLDDKAREGLPIDRPLWQLIIAPGYGRLEDTVLIWRFHGSMYDGVTIAKVISYSIATPQNVTFKACNQYYQLTNHLYTFLCKGPARFLWLLISRRRQCRERRNGSKKVERTVYHSWSERTLSLPLLLKNKMLLNMTCNDLLLTLLTGAARTQLAASPGQDCEDLRFLRDAMSFLIPFDMWTNLKNKKTLPQGNHLLMVPCPTGAIAEVIPRLWHIEDSFTDLKKSGDTRVQLYVMNWLHYLPFTKNISRSVNAHLLSDCTSLITSFNGPNTVDFIDGASVRDIMFYTYPPPGVHHSLNLISYSGTIKLMTLSTSQQLTSSMIDSFIVDMKSQLCQINSMVFQRYFPDGVGKSVNPYSSQASRLFTEFLTKLKDIDEMCPAETPPVMETEVIESRATLQLINESRAQASEMVSVEPKHPIHDVDSGGAIHRKNWRTPSCRRSFSEGSVAVNSGAQSGHSQFGSGAEARKFIIQSGGALTDEGYPVHMAEISPNYVPDLSINQIRLSDFNTGRELDLTKDLPRISEELTLSTANDQTDNLTKAGVSEMPTTLTATRNKYANLTVDASAPDMSTRDLIGKSVKKGNSLTGEHRQTDLPSISVSDTALHHYQSNNVNTHPRKAKNAISEESTYHDATARPDGLNADNVVLREGVPDDAPPSVTSDEGARADANALPVQEDPP